MMSMQLSFYLVGVALSFAYLFNLDTVKEHRGEHAVVAAISCLLIAAFSWALLVCLAIGWIIGRVMRFYVLIKEFQLFLLIHKAKDQNAMQKEAYAVLENVKINIIEDLSNTFTSGLNKPESLTLFTDYFKDNNITYTNLKDTLTNMNMKEFGAFMVYIQHLEKIGKINVMKTKKSVLI